MPPQTCDCPPRRRLSSCTTRRRARLELFSYNGRLGLCPLPLTAGQPPFGWAELTRATSGKPTPTDGLNGAPSKAPIWRALKGTHLAVALR